MTAVQTQDATDSLMGDLATWPLSDLLTWLHQGRYTALVRVGHGLAAGVIFFENGELFRCEWGHLRGESALSGLLTLRGGTFSLVRRGIAQAQPNIHRPTPEVLLQCAIAHDEARRTAGAPG